MDTRQIKMKLLEKERELLADIATLEQEARNAREAEVEDPIDEVTSAEGKAVAFEESKPRMADSEARARRVAAHRK